MTINIQWINNETLLNSPPDKDNGYWLSILSNSSSSYLLLLIITITESFKIIKAVKNHNKFKIEDGLSERESLFSKIARDADKLDILYVLGQEKYKEILRQDEQELSNSLIESFLNHQSGNIKDVTSENDSLFITFSYIYDINFKVTYEIIHKEKYYDKIYERINRKDIFKPYLNYVNKYIQERID